MISNEKENFEILIHNAKVKKNRMLQFSKSKCFKQKKKTKILLTKILFALIMFFQLFTLVLSQLFENDNQSTNFQYKNKTTVENIVNDSNKRRQYIQNNVLSPLDANFLPNDLNPSVLTPALPLEPLLPEVLPSLALTSKCPNGKPSLPVECDPKRPWPQCPPQSYCYATNTVDIGPYYCCPIWSTYGATWRPARPFFNYAPSLPPNWPSALHFSDSFPLGISRKNKK